MDYREIHKERERTIIKSLKDTGILTLVREKQAYKVENNEIVYYEVIYLEKKMCRFSIRTGKESNTIINMKENVEIIDKRSIDEFVIRLLKYVKKIWEDYEKIKKTYYINRVNYYNEIYLKKPFHTIYYRVIYINFDNTYNVFLNNGEVVKYNEIDHVLQSFHLTESKRTIFYNICKKIRII